MAARWLNKLSVNQIQVHQSGWKLFLLLFLFLPPLTSCFICYFALSCSCSCCSSPSSCSCSSDTSFFSDSASTTYQQHLIPSCEKIECKLLLFVWFSRILKQWKLKYLGIGGQRCVADVAAVQEQNRDAASVLRLLFSSPPGPDVVNLFPSGPDQTSIPAKNSTKISPLTLLHKGMPFLPAEEALIHCWS